VLGRLPMPPVLSSMRSPPLAARAACPRPRSPLGDGRGPAAHRRRAQSLRRPRRACRSSSRPPARQASRSRRRWSSIAPPCGCSRRRGGCPRSCAGSRPPRRRPRPTAACHPSSSPVFPPRSARRSCWIAFAPTAAEGLGYASAEQVDAERTFVELGLDSLAAIGIRDGLAEATGVELPIPFLAGLPTLVEIARYLEGRLSAPGADPGGGGEAQDTFVSLLGEARERGKSSEFMGLLADASKLRATFDAVPPTEDLPRVVTLAEGDDRPRLILLPSLVAMSGPQEYVRFASGFRGRREVSAVVLPGYARKEPLPAGVGVLAEAGAEAILRSGLGSDFALAGYSSGGLGRACRRGPAGV
jgi:acyl carrier protein